MIKSRYHFGILGRRISYTLSPTIFAEIARLDDCEIEFSIFDCSADELHSVADSLKEIDGFSVTIPHKQKIMPFLDDLSNVAREIGAVNSVKVQNGRMVGNNTDAAGFIYPLRAGKRLIEKILILGNGGAARAVLWALSKEYPQAQLSVCGRDIERVRGFVDSFDEGRIGAGTGTLIFADIGDNDRYDLIVNCTPAGSGSENISPLAETFSFAGRPLCYDLIYRPSQTVFLKKAEKNGCETINGISMLVIQALTSYIDWTGREIELDKMGLAISKKIMDIKEK